MTIKDTTSINQWSKRAENRNWVTHLAAEDSIAVVQKSKNRTAHAIGREALIETYWKLELEKKSNWSRKVDGKHWNGEYTAAIRWICRCMC